MVKTGKIQKKGFFEVTSALTATKMQLYAASPEELNGKIVKLDLTRNLRGKSLELQLRIIASGTTLTSEPVGLELMGSYIRRAFRKGADYVEDAFTAECKDARVTIKPFMLTRNKVSRAIRKSIRNNARDYILGYVKTRTSKEIFNDIMNNKIQKELSLKLKKVYPLALCEIRIFEVIQDKPALLVKESKAEVKTSEESVKPSKKVKEEKKE